VSRKRHATPPLPDVAPANFEDHRPSALRNWVALIWLIGFVLFFYSFTLPNNPIRRVDVWLALPLHFLNLVDPLPNATATPSGWMYFPQRFDLMLVAGVILAGAWGLGHLVLRWIQPPLPAGCVERTVFAFALGLSGLSLLTLACGLAGALSRALLGGLILACVLAECRLRFFEKRNIKPAAKSTPPKSKPAKQIPVGSSLRAVCIVVALPFVLSMLLGSMLPSTDFDAKEYHLQGPKEFYQAGRITFLPHNVYTSFPFLTEMLNLLAMVLRNDWYWGALAGKAVLMCFGLLTSMALYAAGRRWFSPSVGWLAATIHLTTPWTYRISTIAGAEGGLTFYLMAALLAVMIGIERLSANKISFRQFLLAGLLAGSAMACKYPGVLSVVIPLGGAVLAAPFVKSLPLKQRSRVAVTAAAVFAAGVLVSLGPWLVKNLSETGNPVYPLLYTVFGGEDWDAQLNAKWRAAHSPEVNDQRGLLFWFVDVTARNDWLSPLLYAFAPLALLVTTHKYITRLIWLYVAYLFFTWWCFTHRLDRFWVPMIPAVALLAGIGAASRTAPIWRSVGGWRFAVGTCVVAAALFNLGIITSGMAGYNAYLVDLNYAREWPTKHTRPEIAQMNRRLPPNSKVLCVGEAMLFDARFAVVYNTVFDRSIFQQWCAEEQIGVPPGELPMRDPKIIQQKLREEGITHVFVNWAEILRYRTSYGYTDFVTPKRFARLQEQGVLGTPRRSGNPLPFGYRDESSLTQQERAEVNKWAPELNTTINDKPVVITSQLFPVKH
jgi:4-amino-4-deoxy-L-arabinose transferase-like glycosyltransferase